MFYKILKKADNLEGWSLNIAKLGVIIFKLYRLWSHIEMS